MTDQELKEFVVRKTNITDSTGVRRLVGDTAFLNEVHAEQFHKLGYLEVPMGKFYEGGDDAQDSEQLAELIAVQKQIIAATEQRLEVANARIAELERNLSDADAGREVTEAKASSQDDADAGNGAEEGSPAPTTKSGGRKSTRRSRKAEADAT